MTKFPPCRTTQIAQARRSTQRTLRATPQTSDVGHRSRPYLRFTGYRVDQSLVLYVPFISFSFCFRPLALDSRNSSSTLARLPFQTPHLLNPRRLRTRCHALDYDLDFSLFRAPHPLAVVVARVSHRLAGLRLWFSHSFPSDCLALRFNCPFCLGLYYQIPPPDRPGLAKKDLPPRFSRFFFTCVSFRPTLCCHSSLWSEAVVDRFPSLLCVNISSRLPDRSQTEPPRCRSSL